MGWVRLILALCVLTAMFPVIVVGWAIPGLGWLMRAALRFDTVCMDWAGRVPYTEDN